MKKALGILVLLFVVSIVTVVVEPRFAGAYNLQNLLQRTALFGIISIGVSFVIITGGIDLSIGSVICLVGSLLPWLMVENGWSVPAALAAVAAVSVVIGLVHGLLVTRLRLPPFVVTLCGLLFYRGLARWITDDRVQGFGNAQKDGLRMLATEKAFSLPVPFISWISEGRWSSHRIDPRGHPVLDPATGNPESLDLFTWIDVPLPFLLMVAVAVLAALFLNGTVQGRHLLAVGSNERAARHSGIRTDRVIVSAYVTCSVLAGLGGVLFALDLNSVQPASHGNFYELYAIAAAVLGGCSLRGGEGSILGVVIGAAVMRVLYNSINLLGIPTQLEFAIIGLVLLAGVIADTLVKRVVAARRART